jgi:putative glutamine amidotransferase
MKIGIIGPRTKLQNYVNYVESIGATPVATLLLENMRDCDGLILPGGGDIFPAFYAQRDDGCRDTSLDLDIVQMQAFRSFCRQGKPILGICRGLQVINVALGGTLIQDLPPDMGERHSYQKGDKYHASVTREGSVIQKLYGEKPVVNSAHHQAIDKLGKDLEIIQWCPDDNCVEAIAHTSLPILGVQWHPERIDEAKAGISGEALLTYFASLASSRR